MTGSHTAVVTSRTAEVFALSDQVVLKLYHVGWEARAAREAHIARLVQDVGVRCPEVLGYTEHDGRAGIMYSRVHGRSLAHWLGLKRPWRIDSTGQIMAQAHADLHTYHAPELPSLRERLERDILAADLVSPETRALALRTMQMLPDGDTLCHGDLTIDNVLLTAEGPIVIDWPEAARGDPAADVANTVMYLAIAFKNYYSPPRRPLARYTHSRLSAAYLAHYQTLQPDAATRMRHWLLPVAVARLSRGTPISRQYLLTLIPQLADRAALL